MSTSRLLTQSMPSQPSPEPPTAPGARFVAGTVLAGRFRIVGPLGRGGMGEVYRAEDLTLGQPVALKFLPAAMADDPEHRARMLEEVRAARQVTHPNVCRVHDLMEAEGRHFLAMELIDGEDLASLLRRVGRLTPDKGLQIARQIAAALAAVHARGILHRDLKPANVMIDGRGEVRLTDFGLAVPATGAGKADLAGTPAYMPWELLAGGQPSVQSDLYALGLVLYELFTGHRAFEARTPAEHPKGPLEKHPVPPTEHVPELPPALAQAIQWCLAQDPMRRPPSALAVLGALPGGDPLAALVAAGETPSPQVVADAGGVGALRPALAWLWFGLLAVLMPLAVWMAHRASLLRHVDLSKSPEVLAERAQQVLTRLGHTAPRRDTAYRLQYVPTVRQEVLRDPSPDRLAALKDARQPLIEFQYRVASGALMPYGVLSQVSAADPAPIQPGMAAASLDMQGRLRHYQSVGPTWLDTAPRPMDWRAVLAEAALDKEPLQPVPPLRTPPVYATSTAAWTLGPLRFEAAERNGRLVWFNTFPDPVQQPPRAAAPVPAWMQFSSTAGTLFFRLIFPGLALGLAYRNWRRGRVDLQGANRVAALIFMCVLFLFTAEAHHGGGFDWEIYLSLNAIRWALYTAMEGWLGYLAMEPFVRRRWPDALIAWTRVLAGRLRDPRVGRDLLIGFAVGWGAASLLPLSRIFGGHPFSTIWLPADGLPAALAHVARNLRDMLFYTLALGVLLTALRSLVRRMAVVVPIATLAISVIGVAGLGHASPIPADYGVCGLWGLLAVGVLSRLGLFALMAFLLPIVTSGIPLWAALGTWPALFTHCVLLLSGGLGLYGLVTSVGQQPLFGTGDDL